MTYPRGHDVMEDQKHEAPRLVFEALLAESPLTGKEKCEWVLRWQEAEAAERRLKAYNEEWDRSLMGVTRFGQ